MRDHGDRQRPAWPIDIRYGVSDIFDMVEIAMKDPNAFSPEVRAALNDDPYTNHLKAQTEATSRAKPPRRGR